MIVALLITLLAGLATSLGGILATHRRMQQRSYFAVALAFAAGAMLFVSFIEMIPHGLGAHEGHDGTPMQWLVYGAFFVGVILVAVIDHLLPPTLNPSEVEGQEVPAQPSDKRLQGKLLRSGTLIAVVLALHNLPEGMSTTLAAYEDISVGIALAVAIAIHNIPEGIAVAAPIYAVTRSRQKAIGWATVSGLTEVIGGVLGLLLVGLIIPASLTGVVFGLVAGMMVFVAIDELLPAARRYQTQQHQVVYGLIGGMGVMALSLLVL